MASTPPPVTETVARFEAVRDAGQLIVEIGIAPVKPAEFVIFRISQYSAGAAEG